VRKQALFWAGQGGTPTSDLLKLYHDFHEPELQRQLIFVLSQRDDSAAVDALIEIARSDPDHSMRKRAFFWLGQKDDPRVIALLTSILEK
jgi:HEAT repeat protein